MHTSVEVYDAGADKWTILAARLPCERKYHTACELNGEDLLLLPHALSDRTSPCPGSCLRAAQGRGLPGWKLDLCRAGVCCGRHD